MMPYLEPSESECLPGLCFAWSRLGNLNELMAYKYCNFPKPPAVCVWEDILFARIYHWRCAKIAVFQILSSSAKLTASCQEKYVFSIYHICIMYMMENTQRYICFDFYMICVYKYIYIYSHGHGGFTRQLAIQIPKFAPIRFTIGFCQRSAIWFHSE